MIDNKFGLGYHGSNGRSRHWLVGKQGFGKTG